MSARQASTREGGKGENGRSPATTLSILAAALLASWAARQMGGPSPAPALPAEREGRGTVSGRRPPGEAAETDGTARDARQTGRGREAASPEEIPARGWWDIGWRVYGEIGRDRIVAVAAGVTFYAILAIFPAIAAFVSLYGLLADPTEIGKQLDALGSVLPGGAIEIIGGEVSRITSGDGGKLGLAFFTGLGLSIWSANAGMKAIFDALNIAYEEEEKRSFLRLNAWSLLFTLGTLVFLAAALAGVVILPNVIEFLRLGPLGEILVSLGRWPAMLLVLLGGLALLYRYGPSRERPSWRWLSPGALVAAFGWLVASLLFSWYASHFGSYNKTYGSLGAAIGFMTWIWISTIIVLLGAEVNAETEHQTKADSTDGAPQPLGARGAHVADTVGASRA